MKRRRSYRPFKRVHCRRSWRDKGKVKFAYAPSDPSEAGAYPGFYSMKRYSIAKISVTSPIVINMPTRELLVGETKTSFV